MSKKCQFSNKVANNAYSISHSHVRTKKRQYINLQKKRIWSSSQRSWITVRISTKAIKSLHKINL